MLNLLDLLIAAILWVAVQALPTVWVSSARKRQLVEAREADALFLSLKERDAKTIASAWNIISKAESRFANPPDPVFPRVVLHCQPRSGRSRAPKRKTEPCKDKGPSAEAIMSVLTNLPKTKSARLRWYLEVLLPAHPHLDASTEQGRQELFNIVMSQEHGQAPTPFTAIGPRYLVPKAFILASTTSRMPQPSKQHPSPDACVLLLHGETSLEDEKNNATPSSPETTDQRHGTPSALTSPTPCAPTEAIDPRHDPLPPISRPTQTIDESQELQKAYPLPSTPSKSEAIDHGHDPLLSSPGVTQTTHESQEPQASPLLATAPKSASSVEVIESAHDLQTSSLCETMSTPEGQEPKEASPLPIDIVVSEVRPSAPSSTSSMTFVASDFQIENSPGPIIVDGAAMKMSDGPLDNNIHTQWQKLYNEPTTPRQENIAQNVTNISCSVKSQAVSMSPVSSSLHVAHIASPEPAIPSLIPQDPSTWSQAQILFAHRIPEATTSTSCATPIVPTNVSELVHMSAGKTFSG